MAVRSYCSAAFVLAAFAACHRPTEMAGMYVVQDGMGSLFACDDPKRVVTVQDTALAARYRALAAGSTQPLYVRVRGVAGHEGSIYGGGRYFFVQQILEIRARKSGECPRVAQPASQMLAPS